MPSFLNDSYHFRRDTDHRRLSVGGCALFHGKSRKVASALHYACALIAILAALPAPRALATQMPPGIVNPALALKDPVYSDPVFWWRMTSLPKNIFEPPAYFYWPSAVIKGATDPMPLPVAKPGHTTLSAQALEKAAAWAAAHNSDTLIVIHKGVVQLARYWHGASPKELENGRAITRSVTPLLLGFAVAAGKVALDDPIGKFITEWRHDRRGKITVRQLAEDEAGLEVEPYIPLKIIYGNKNLCLFYCGDVVRAALSYNYARPPGTRFEEASEDMQLLALVITRAMGMPIQDLLSEKVWKPIGASDATFQFDRPNGTARTVCCMRARAMDWARLGLLIAQNGRWNGRQVLPRGWVRTMTTPSPRNPNFGLGIWLGTPYVAMRTYFEGKPGVIPQSEPFLARDVWFMEGGGFRDVFIVPSAQLVIYRHGTSTPHWDQAYLVNLFLRDLHRSKDSRANE